jgi:hypothetical protein
MNPFRLGLDEIHTALAEFRMVDAHRAWRESEQSSNLGIAHSIQRPKDYPGAICRLAIPSGGQIMQSF